MRHWGVEVERERAATSVLVCKKKKKGSVSLTCRETGSRGKIRNLQTLYIPLIFFRLSEH